MNSLSKHFIVRATGVWIVVGVLLFVIGWRLCIVTREYLGAREIADRFTAIRQFKQDIVPNHANTRLTFCQDTESGVGIYFCKTDGGQPRLLCEKKENALQWRRFSMLGWSPDDRLFACALPDEKRDKEFILIFDGTNGNQIAKLEVDQGLYEFTWLTPDSFAYSTHTDMRVVINQGKEWEHKRYFEKVASNLENFMALSDHSVAWREARNIRGLDINSGSPPQEIWKATTNNLVEFTYDKPSGEFLLNCSDENGQYLLIFNSQKNRTVEAGRIGPFQNYVRDAMWTGRETTYAFLTNELAGAGFEIKMEDRLDTVLIPWDGGVGCGGTGGFTLNGRHLYFAGNEEGEPPCIWDYDIKDKSFKKVLSSSEDSLKYRPDRLAASGTLTNSLGNIRYYHLWTPKNIVSGKKYPVLIAQELNTWFPYFEIATDCGYYVAVVDRPFSHTWNGAQQKTWTEDVQSLCASIANKPEINTNKVYFFAYSAETYYLSDLLNRNSQLWKGAVLFSPVSLPDATGLNGKKILLIDGKDDEVAVSRLSEYQNHATALGTSPTIYILANAGHIPQSGASERSRARQFANFLSANR